MDIGQWREKNTLDSEKLKLNNEKTDIELL